MQVILYTSLKLKEEFQKYNNHQNPIVLFINLRTGNVNPQKVLKNQIKFKSGLFSFKNRKSKI